MQIADLIANTRQLQRNAGNNSERSGGSQGGQVNELLRARALEAAREETRELRGLNEQLREERDQLKSGRIAQDEEFAKERNQLASQVQTLQLALEKSKIIVNSNKRDKEQAEAELKKVMESTDAQKQELVANTDERVNALEAKCKDLQNTLR